MAKTDWLRLLGYVTGLVNQELLLKNEYLVAENRILNAHIRGICLPGWKGCKHWVSERGWTLSPFCFKVSFVSQSQFAEPPCPDQRVDAATAPDRGTTGSGTAREAAFGG
jgi:hypothetical protein